ncbi:MAG: hypothetical protein H0W90_09720 [Actinobacteria bacterium]|nr:hypothetical protein [Actinomycetota bacterium]
MLSAGTRSLKQLAAELGCSEQTLRNWWREDQADRGERSDVLSSEERRGCVSWSAKTRCCVRSARS